MAIRSRILSLIYRVAAFGVAVFALIRIFQNDATFEEPYRSILYFGTQTVILTAIIFALEIIFNTVDLIRHGTRGVAASAYMPLVLAVTAYLVADMAIFGINEINHGILFSGIAPKNPETPILEHLVIPLLLLVDWIAFDEKGSVKWTEPLYWPFYPGLYATTLMVVHEIGNSNSFLYEFMNHAKFRSMEGWMSGNDGWSGVIFCSAMFLILFAAMGFLLVFLNNIMGGKYRRKQLGKIR